MHKNKMKLLILTQKVDINDDVLGFFHGWIREFAKNCDKITVVCLQKGEYDLPGNVEVLSLGKEGGTSRIKYIFRFYRYIWQKRKDYDNVFVHMNQIYVLLGGVFWKIWGEKIIFWNNHRQGNFLTLLSSKLANYVFYTSPFSFQALKNKKNACKAPAGIDTNIFKNRNLSKQKNSILYLGRISKIKNLEVLVEAVKILDKKNIDFKLSLAGEAVEGGGDYFRKVKKSLEELERKGKVGFLGSVSQEEAPELYSRNEVFVNMTNSGSFDKVILEAMACEAVVLASNKSFADILPPNFLFFEGYSREMAEKLEKILQMDKFEKDNHGKKFREWVRENHNLKILVKKILEKLNE